MTRSPRRRRSSASAALCSPRWRESIRAVTSPLLRSTRPPTRAREACRASADSSPSLAISTARRGRATLDGRRVVGSVIDNRAVSRDGDWCPCPGRHKRVLRLNRGENRLSGGPRKRRPRLGSGPKTNVPGDRGGAASDQADQRLLQSDVRERSGQCRPNGGEAIGVKRVELLAPTESGEAALGGR